MDMSTAPRYQVARFGFEWRVGRSSSYPQISRAPRWAPVVVIIDKVAAKETLSTATQFVLQRIRHPPMDSLVVARPRLPTEHVISLF